ncbi:hypothetical protein EBU71_15845 [bacterium]|nr:hypothetical protein [Candidatus Elulimicrobium humile]
MDKYMKMAIDKPIEGVKSNGGPFGAVITKDAASWAHIPQMYYYQTREDAQNIGFDDAKLYTEINKDI